MKSMMKMKHFEFSTRWNQAELTVFLSGTSPPLTADNTKDLMSIHINQVILASYSEWKQLLSQ